MQMEMSKERAILAQIGKGKRPTAISEQLGVPLTEVIEIYKGRVGTGSREIGREELRPYIVAVTVAGQAWSPRDRKAILSARMRYDQGLDEMCTGRDGAFLILYSIPRIKRVEPRGYFFGE